jgi:hypothetical protein
MKLFETLDEETFVLFAAKNYYNPTCIDAEEFYSDLKRFNYVKRLLTRYEETKEIQSNLMLNHLTVIFNVFGYQSGLKMLEYKLTKEQIVTLKPFLLYLKVITNDKYTGTRMDKNIIDSLRKI